MCLIVSRTIITLFNRPMTLSMALWAGFLLPIMTGRIPMGQSGKLTWKRSIINAMPSFIRLSRLTGLRAISAIIPICKNKKNNLSVWFSPSQNNNRSSLTDNLWSNIRWQWWQWVVLWTWKRTTTWFHHWSCPRCCGRPVTSHLGNPLNSRNNFFRLSMVTKHSTWFWLAPRRATPCQTACP